MNSFLGQVPLVLGPGSWGFPGLVPGAAPQGPACPPGTFMADDGTCRPRTTQEGAPRTSQVPMFLTAVPTYNSMF